MMITDKRGFFNKKIWDSKIHSEDTTAKEKVFGYLLGPVGALLLNTILEWNITIRKNALPRRRAAIWKKKGKSAMANSLQSA